MGLSAPSVAESLEVESGVDAPPGGPAEGAREALSAFKTFTSPC